MKNLTIILIFFLSLTGYSQTSKEIEMVKIINELRTNPKSFIPVVEAYIQSTNKLTNLNVKFSYKSNPNKNINANIIIEAKELIVFLNTVKPVNVLSVLPILYPITKTHAIFLDSTKQLSHTGINGKTFSERTKYTNLSVGENCVNSPSINSALLQLLIDLGNKNKGHRANIFNPNYINISVGNAGNVWVQDFAY